MKIKSLLFVSAFLALSTSAMADEFSVPDVEIQPGQEVEVEVSLTNPDVAYCIFTVDLMLPDGITVASTLNKKGNVVYTETCKLNEDRIEDHQLTVGAIEGGFRFLGKSDTNSEFYETEGTLFTVTLKADENIAPGKYTAKLIADGETAGGKLQVCCDPAGNQYFLKDVEFTITVPEVEEEPDPEFYNKQFLVIDDASSNLGEGSFTVAIGAARATGNAKIVGDAIKVYVRSIEEAVAAGNPTTTNNQELAEDYGNWADWDTQFFITFGEDNKLEAGSKIRLMMDVKADVACNVGPQSHAAPGTYIDWQCVGGVDFGTDWTPFDSGDKEVGQGPANGMYTFAFGLANKDFLPNTFYFKNIKVVITKPKEQIIYDDAEVVVNNACDEGGDDYNYWCNEWRDMSAGATVFHGKAKLEGGAVKVYVRSREQAAEAGNATLTGGDALNEDFSNYADWDSQFFIRFDPNRALEPGDKMQLKMKVKADVAQEGVGTQCHAEPGEYLHWNCFGNVNFTTEFAEFTSNQLEAAPRGDDGNFPWNMGAAGTHCIAFNLAKGIENTYYFDDISLIVSKKTTATGVYDTFIVKPTKGVRYNLAGQKVDENYKGIVIENGRKFYNK